MKKLLSSILFALILVQALIVTTYAADVSFSLGSVTGEPGENVEITLSLSSGVDITNFSLSGMSYDTTKLEFTGFSGYGEVATSSMLGTAGIDSSKKAIAIAYMPAKKISGTVCTLCFKIKDSAKSGDVTVSMSATAKNGSASVSAYVSSGTITVYHEHSYGNWTKKDANTHTCSCACGDVQTENHTWDGGKVTTAATHTTDGVKTFTCTKCGATKTEIIPADKNNHSYGDWTKKDADYHTRSCSCGSTETEKHTWDNGKVTTAATHTKDGVKTYTCTKCGATKTEVIAKDANAHTYGDWTKKDADYHTRSCSCGSTETEKHTWDDGKVTTAATHTTDGVKTFTCTKCGATKTEIIAKDANAHTYGNWTKKDSEYHTHSCSCGSTETEKHTWDGGKVTTAATHTTDGVKTFTCTKCGATKTEKIPAEKDNHSFSDWVAIDEHTHSRKCECGKEEKETHSESGWIIDKNPTTTSEGSRHKECNECGYVLVTEVIAKLDNSDAESNWEKIHNEVTEQYFKISVSQNEGGKVKTTPEKSVKYGDDVIITIIPDEGYEVESLTVKGKNVGKVTSYTLKNASSDVNITVKFKEAKWKNPFTDISESDNYYKAVQYVYENELFKGVSEHQFAPNKTMTRAMFVTVLGRLAKVDESKYTKTSFTDAKSGEWYSAYVEWAAENGIVNGYGNGKFGVNDEVTIEQAAAIIARYARFIKIDTIGKTLGNYSDKSNVSDWAVDDMAWLTSTGIYAPKNNKLLPREKAERQLVATMISGFAEKFVK